MRPQVPTHPDDDRLLELAYGEVPASEARALRTHVDGCARCRTVLDGIAEVRTAFRSVPAEPAPERGLDSLLAYGEQAAARARSRRRGMRIVGVLSAVAALAVVWVVLPPPGQRAEGEAGATAARPSDGLARADRERAPAQGDRAKDEQPEKGGAPSSPATSMPSAPLVAKKENPAPEQPGPARRALEKSKDVAKRDAPAEQKALAQGPASGRPESVLLDRGAAQSNARGALSAAGAGTSGGMAMKKSAAGADVAADKTGPAGSAGVPAPTSASEVARSEEAAKVAAAPMADALASKPLAKVAPSSEPAVRAAQPQAAARVGAGSAEQHARLADIQKKLATARGDERKALLMEQCELEASLQRGPDAVLTCSTVAREFPGTPEARRASEIARGFSLQLPVEPSER